MKRIVSHPAFHILILVALGALLYAGTFEVPFHFDDIRNIKENPIVHDLKFFPKPHTARGLLMYQALRTRYMGFLSFALNYHYGGPDVTGYHVVNLCIHILNALLVYVLVLLSFRTPVLRDTSLKDMSRWVALFAAALFVAQPVQTQAVTYIVQRLASLMALFYLGAMAAYIKARVSDKWVTRIGFYLAALCLAILAMKTKENAFTLPLAIALYELIFFRSDRKKRALLLVPVLLTLFIIPMTFLGQDKPVADIVQSIEERTAEHPIPRGQYLLTQSRVVATYLRLLILPFNQSLDYDYPLYHSLLQAPVLLSLLLHIALVVLAALLLKKGRPEFRLVSFGILFFYLSLSVESALIPLHPIFEHRLYLPSAGALTSMAVSLLLLLTSRPERRSRMGLMVVPLAVVLVLGAATWQRNTVWQSYLNLWKDVVEKAPLNSRARNNLGNSYYLIGLLDEAMEQYKAAVQYDPTNTSALNNVGLVLLKMKRTEEATKYFKEAIRYQPANAYAYNNLGAALMDMGRTEEAIQQLKVSIHYNPGFADPHANLGRCYFDLKRYAEAKQHLQTAVSLNPKDYSSFRLLRLIKNMGK